MEALLKFWRNSSPDTAVAGRDIVSELDDLDYVRNPVIVTDEETDDDDDDSFFDLVFTGPDRRPKLDNNSNSLSPNQPQSPKDVFYKPKPFEVDPNSKPQSPVSILRSAPKFRVFFLGFKKSKPEDKAGIDDSPKSHSKRFTVKEVPVFTRDNSLRSKLKEDKEEDVSSVVKSDVSKYLKLMKPLYAKASKRYTDKIKVTNLVSTASSPFSSPSPRKLATEEKQGNRVAAFGAMRKHLGKSRSALSSSAVAGVSWSPMNRRDDSLMEQSDGIQGAILHCKRSYSSAPKDCSVLLTRSASEEMPRTSSAELNRWSI